MGISYYFFDNQSIYQADWKKTLGTNLNDGVVCGAPVGSGGAATDLFVYSAESSIQVMVKSGMFHIKGNYCILDADATVTLAAVPASPNYRWDVIVGQVDWSAKSMSVAVVTGTAGASPTIPALTRTGTVWQIPLALVYVAYSNTYIPKGQVYDLRGWALGTFNLAIVIGTGNSVITTGVMPAGVVVPARSKIVACELTADATGSIGLDVWKKAISSYPPTVSDTICNASYHPGLSSARSGYKTVWDEATYVNGNALYWTAPVFDPSETDQGGKLAVLVNVESAATVKQVCMNLIFARMISA